MTEKSLIIEYSYIYLITYGFKYLLTREYHPTRTCLVYMSLTETMVIYLDYSLMTRMTTDVRFVLETAGFLLSYLPSLFAFGTIRPPVSTYQI
jgi:hypothetical protein